MSQLTPEAEAFLGPIAKAIDLWQSLDVRVVALWADEQWHAYRVHVHLDHRAPRRVLRVRGATSMKPLLATQVVLPIAELRPLLTAFASGRWKAGPHHLVLGGFAGQGIKYDHEHFDHGTRLWHSEEEWPVHILRGSGGDRHDLFAKVPGATFGLDRHVQNLPTSYPLASRLMSELLGARIEPSSDGPGVLVRASYGLRFEADSVVCEDGHVRWTIVAAGEPPARLCSVRDQSRVARVGPFQQPVAGWTKRSGGQLSWDGRVPVKSKDPVDLALFANGRPVEWAQASGTHGWVISPLGRAYAEVDPDYAVLTNALAADPPKPNRKQEKRKGHNTIQQEFEEAVRRLFALGGWTTDQFRHPSIGDSTDTLCYAPALGRVLAIETTLAGPENKDKAAKLQKRRTALREALAPLRVDAVLATALKGEAIDAGTRGRFADDGMWLCARENLAELLDLVREGATPSTMVSYLEAKATTPRPMKIPKGPLPRR